MARKKGDRQSEVLRRLQQGSGRKATQLREAREAMAQELADPTRFAAYLRTFSQLCLVLEELRPVRFPALALVDAVLDAEVDPQLQGLERVRALRQAVVPGFASREAGQACSQAIQLALGSVEDRDALFGLTAGGALNTNCLEEQARADHPFWEIVFEVTLTEALLSGLFLIRFVMRGLDPSTAEAGPAFAKALAAGEHARELEKLGVSADAGALSRAYAEALAREDPYHLQMDAVLHLAHTHVHLAGSGGQRMAAEGWSPELASEFRAAYEEAYAGDVDEGLAKELGRWCRARLEALRDEPEQLERVTPRGVEDEQLRCAATWLALQVIPRERDPLLRSIHLQSLVRARLAAGELEAGFVAKVWSSPDDLFALEEYERFLLQRQEPNRSRRVGRFRKWVEARRRESQAPESEAPESEAPGSEAPGSEAPGSEEAGEEQA